MLIYNINIELDEAKTADPKVSAAIDALVRDGKLLASDVFEAAKDPNSPLHEFFEWDHEIAWRAHNHNIACALIESQ